MPAPDPHCSESFDCSNAAADAAVLSLFHPIVRVWWLSAFSSAKGIFTPAQRQAAPLIQQGKNVLICSPTGSGKTLSAFISIINQLFLMAEKGVLENTVYCIYVSPLKSLANDIHKNLERPLQEMAALAEETGLKVQEIRHSVRHGDVSAREKARMLKRTPHILNTTPESLAILLSSPRFREKLGMVRWVIVDEIHSLAASKRGVHLSLSLERLEELKREVAERRRLEGPCATVDPAEGGFVRIGCSATVEPVEEVAGFLAGRLRPVEIVDCRLSRLLDLRLICPVPDLILADQIEISDGLYGAVHRHVQDHKTTIIFANSRSGAESVLNNLRARFALFYDEDNSACHHGSMGIEGRTEAERRLKDGQIKVVCTSTSLELGIDMPGVDLVLQIGSPKSVTALLQRFGRAGHRLDQVAKGRVIVLDREELIECAVMLERARAGDVEAIHIPRNALDALCQHILGMALERDWTIDEALAMVRRSFCYATLSEEEMMSVVSYLSGADPKLRERHVYPKIRYDPRARKISKLGGGSRMIYYTNSGMIPDHFTCDLFTREGRFVGRLDEGYLEKLEPGDLFSVGGLTYSFCYRRGGRVHVQPAEGRPKIPVWSSERLPLSFDLGRSILSFHADMLWMMNSHAGRDGGREIVRWLQIQYPIDENSARSIFEIFRQQAGFLGDDSIPAPWRMVVQECQEMQSGRRIWYVLSGYGLRFNEALARMAAYLLSRQRAGEIFTAASDFGFVLFLPASGKASLKAVIASIREENCELLLRRALWKTSLLKSLFRINAARSYLILKSYKGRQRSARHQQFDADMLIGLADSLEDFAVLEECYREIIEDRLEIERIMEVLRGLACGEIEVALKAASTPCPMAFGLAALGAAAGERREMMREMQAKVEGRIDETD